MRLRLALVTAALAAVVLSAVAAGQPNPEQYASSLTTVSWQGSVGFGYYNQNVEGFGLASTCLPAHYWLRVRFVKSDGTVWQFNDGPRGPVCGSAATATVTKPPLTPPAVQAQCIIKKDAGYANINREGFCLAWH